MDMMFWNILLTVTLALLGWWGQSMYKEVQRLSILLNASLLFFLSIEDSEPVINVYRNSS